MLENVIRYQQILFAERLQRLELLKLKINTENSVPVALNIHRNHSFEPLMQPVQTFLAYSQLRPEWFLSDYDDALSFNQIPASAGMEIIWLDYERYDTSEGVDVFN